MLKSFVCVKKKFNRVFLRVKCLGSDSESTYHKFKQLHFYVAITLSVYEITLSFYFVKQRHTGHSAFRLTISFCSLMKLHRHTVVIISISRINLKPSTKTAHSYIKSVQTYYKFSLTQAMLSSENT